MTTKELRIPPEIFIKIFKYLCIEDLGHAKLTCKRWQDYVTTFQKLEQLKGKSCTNVS